MNVRLLYPRPSPYPFLIDLLRSGQARPVTTENAAAILLALWEKDGENLGCIGRLGAQIALFVSTSVLTF
jgi:hypothetical protein